MFKCWVFFFPVFHPGHHIFQVPLNSDTSGLRQTSFIYLRSGLAELCQAFCERLRDLQAPSLQAPRVLRIPPRLVTPRGTWGSTPDPVALRCHEKTYPTALGAEAGVPSKGRTGPPARPPGQASSLGRRGVNASASFKRVLVQLSHFRHVLKQFCESRL